MDEEEKRYIEEQLKHVEKTLDFLNKSIDGRFDAVSEHLEFDENIMDILSHKIDGPGPWILFHGPFEYLFQERDIYEKKRADLKNSGKKWFGRDLWMKKKKNISKSN